jgi:hypothetical protein
MTIRWLMIGGAALALLAMGCGKAAVPNDQLGKTEAEIRAAQVKYDELKAAGPSEGAPAAELHLQLATKGVKDAKALMERKDNEEAMLVLQRAEADAKYALALAQEYEAKARAEEALEKLKELKEKASE